MIKRDVKPLPEGFLDSFSSAIAKQQGVIVESNQEEIEEQIEEAVGDTALAYQTPYGTATATKSGKQDGYSLSLKTKSGKTVDLGSHPKPTKANVMSIVKNVMQKESVDEGSCGTHREQMINAVYSEMKGMSMESLCAMANQMEMSCGKQESKEQQLDAMYKEMKDMSDDMITAMYEKSCGSVSEAKLDPVDKKAVKKDFDDREDQDIDNDGDVDSSDKYLHKRRKAISKAIGKKKETLSEVEDEDDEDEKRVECPECKGKGCDHCGDTGYHIEESGASCVSK